jgi:hypothetical protein
MLTRLNYFRALPLQQQKLLTLLLSLICASFFVGLCWVLLGLNDENTDRSDVWMPSVIAPQPDNDQLYTVLSRQPRWFNDGKIMQVAASTSDISLEGYRLTGLVTKGDKRYALFLGSATKGRSKESQPILQRAQGELLAGEWVIKEIADSHVDVQRGDTVQTLKMYDIKGEAKAKKNAKRTRR